MLTSSSGVVPASQPEPRRRPFMQDLLSLPLGHKGLGGASGDEAGVVSFSQPATTEFVFLSSQLSQTQSSRHLVHLYGEYIIFLICF